MVRSSGQPATAARASSSGARNSQAVRRRRPAREAPGATAGLPAAATAQPFQAPLEHREILGRAAVAGERRVHGSNERAGNLVVAAAGDRRRPRHGILEDRSEEHTSELPSLMSN